MILSYNAYEQTLRERRRFEHFKITDAGFDISTWKYGPGK
jgi:hypothetical protein